MGVPRDHIIATELSNDGVKREFTITIGAPTSGEAAAVHIGCSFGPFSTGEPWEIGRIHAFAQACFEAKFNPSGPDLAPVDAFFAEFTTASAASKWPTVAPSGFWSGLTSADRWGVVEAVCSKMIHVYMSL